VGVDLDLVAFFDTDAFAQTATYTRIGYPSVSISVIFDSEYSVVEGVVETGMGVPAPQALCKSSDVANASRGDTLLVGGMTYYVLEVKPDGTGVTTLVLSKDAP
jgi:hypothetical protein